MLTNLLLGTLFVATTVLIHTVGLMVLSGLMERIIRWLRLHSHISGKTVAMVATVLGIFVLQPSRFGSGRSRSSRPAQRLRSRMPCTSRP